MDNKTFEEIKFDLMKEDQKILVKKLYDGGYDKAAQEVLKQRKLAPKSGKQPRAIRYWQLFRNWLLVSDKPALPVLFGALVGMLLLLVLAYAILPSFSFSRDEMAAWCLVVAFAAMMCGILITRCSGLGGFAWAITATGVVLQLVVCGGMAVLFKTCSGGTLNLLAVFTIIGVYLSMGATVYFAAWRYLRRL